MAKKAKPAPADTPRGEEPVSEQLTPAEQSMGSPVRPSKAEMIRVAFQELGMDSPVQEVQSFIQARYGEEVAAPNIYQLRNKLKGNSSPKVSRKPQPAPQQQGLFSAEDFREVKNLTSRLGMDKVRSLLDLMEE